MFTRDELQQDIERAEYELLSSLTEMRRLLRLLPHGAHGRDQISELSRTILALEGDYAVICPLCGGRMARKERYFHRSCADAEQAWADQPWTEPSGLIGALR